MDFQVALVVNLPANTGVVRDKGSIPRSRRHPAGGHGYHSNILAWKLTENWVGYSL